MRFNLSLNENEEKIMLKSKKVFNRFGTSLLN